MKLDIDVGGTEAVGAAVFLLFCSHRGQRGLGSITLIIVRRTTNGASWKIGLFLKPIW